MKKKPITYLDKAGLKESPACLAAAAERAAELKLTHVVVATSSGRTALEMARALRAAGSKAAVIGVGYAANFAAKWGALEKKFTAPAEKLGCKFITGTHPFGGVNGSVRDKFGGSATPGGIIAATYYTFGQGLKVAVEVALMAADQGVLATGTDAMALGGTAEGADTALVLVPQCSQEFFKLRIREIVCMPR